MDNNSFYRPTGNIKDTNRTYVPDMYRQVAAEMQEEDAPTNVSPSEHVIKLQNRSIIGVLYSISAGIEGELFPVYIGRNTIGSDPTCDICLRETSVSAQHGILLARKQTNQEGEEYVNVILSDTNSSYGTSINGERLSFERVSCIDGDIISIGQNYVLVLSLFKAIDKLSVAYGFDRIPEQKTEEKTDSVPQQPLANEIGSPISPLSDEHSTNITKDNSDRQEAGMDFYKPSRQQGQDHYNNKTIII